jgi:hypothetical protein
MKIVAPLLICGQINPPLSPFERESMVAFFAWASKQVVPRQLFYNK